MLVPSLLAPLIGFFVYAVQIQTRFFVFIIAALFISIVVLCVFYYRLKLKKVAAQLQREDYFEKANLLKADLVTEEQVISAFRDKIVAYAQLKNLLESMSMNLTLDEAVHTLCRETANLFDSAHSTIILYLIDPVSGELAIVFAARQHHAVTIKLKKGDIFDRWVLKTMQALHIEDIHNDFRFDLDKVDGEDRRPVHALISVPMIVHNTPIGILRLDSSRAGLYSKEDLRFLKAIGDMAAVAIENAQLYDKVEDLAIRDGLTGLFLRRYLLERMTVEIARHLRREKSMAFIMFDLDYFKKYNDSFGHPAGDLLLKSIADLLKSHFGEPGELICRYGGEEFCVLIPECDGKDVRDRVQKFVRAAAKEQVLVRRERTHITVSAGLAMLPGNARTRDDLILRTDEALYEAKKKGRDRLVVAS